MSLGKKVKNLRVKIGLTQEELAVRSDLTKGFISQLEHDNTSPSIDTMEKIVTALGTNMSDFFKDECEERIVYGQADVLSDEYDDMKMKIDWLIPDAQKNLMEPVILELKQGGFSKEYKPFEGEAFGYVLKGSVILKYGSKEYKIKKGECFYYSVDRISLVKNPTNKVAKLLWVLTPPNF